MKLLKYFLIVMLLNFSFCLNVYASEISDYKINEFSNNTVVSGNLPKVESANESLSKLINAEIKNVYTTKADNAKNSNAKTLDFSYEIYNNDKITSIVILSTISNLKSVNYIDTIVYDDDKIYTLDTYLSKTDLKVFNTNINDEIRKSQENYSVSSLTLNDKTDFYIKDNIVYAVFDANSISSSSDIITFAYRKTKLNTYILKEDSYFVQNVSQVKYVPIREVYDRLGYNVVYKDKLIDILDENEKVIVSFNIDDLRRSKREIPPVYNAVIIDGVSYAPLSTVKSTTNTVYDIKSDGDIVFTVVENATSRR